MAFCWRADDGPILNAGLVALRLFTRIRFLVVLQRIQTMFAKGCFDLRRFNSMQGSISIYHMVLDCHPVVYFNVGYPQLFPQHAQK